PPRVDPRSLHDALPLEPRLPPGPGRAAWQLGVGRAAGQRRLGQPDHGDQLRRGKAGLHRFQRRLLGEEPPRRDRLYRQVSGPFAGHRQPAGTPPAADCLSRVRKNLHASRPTHMHPPQIIRRVAALEQQAANNRGNVDLLNQVNQIKNELQALRSQIEELQRASEQLESTGRAQYLDLDGRLNRLEGGGAPTLDPGSVPAATPAVSAPAAVEAAPAVYGDPGAMARTADERGAYEVAFDALKGGRYDESARLFTEFLQLYPSGAYAPNAYYWLGESYYITQNYALAQQQFQAVLDRYPTHDKAPGALLK